LHFANFSHNIQATRTPKDQKKKKEEAYMYHGEEGIKSFQRHTFFGRRFGEE
jgi:hypothetical protein